MIKGVGIDTVSIEKTKNLLSAAGEIYVSNVYTEYEAEKARHTAFPAEYLSARFAAKEAVFKAVAPFMSGKSFDLRQIEVRNREDGSPYVQIDENMKKVLCHMHAESILISITTEDDYATAIAIVE